MLLNATRSNFPFVHFSWIKTSFNNNPWCRSDWCWSLNCKMYRKQRSIEPTRTIYLLKTITSVFTKFVGSIQRYLYSVFFRIWLSKTTKEQSRKTVRLLYYLHSCWKYFSKKILSHNGWRKHFYSYFGQSNSWLLVHVFSSVSMMTSTICSSKSSYSGFVFHEQYEKYRTHEFFSNFKKNWFDYSLFEIKMRWCNSRYTGGNYEQFDLYVVKVALLIS